MVGGHPRLGVEGAVGHGQLRLDRPADRVRLAGLFSAATCLVVPSLSEPFGIVYVEAAAFGGPSIAGLVGGTATAVGDGGLLVDPRSDGAILDAMRRLADPPTAGRLGARARRRSVRFTWRQVAERLLRAAGLPHPHGAPLADFLDDAGADAPDDAVADVTDRPEPTGTAPTGTAPTGTAPHAMSPPTIRPSTVREVRP